MGEVDFTNKVKLAVAKAADAENEDAVEVIDALLSQLEEMREREKRSSEVVSDALAGWRYIREHHGDLYGVAWDRVEGRLAALLSQTDEVKSDG